MQISKPQLSDVQTLAELENSTFLSDKISKKQFIHNINKQKYFFVAKINNELAGYILCFEYKKTIRIHFKQL